jgi:phosphoribosylanthranilate isomerase
MFLGVDLNSKFESEPGLKNITELKTFIEKLRK